MYTVDKGIVISTYGARGTKAKYPWADLKVGDSFFIACEGEDRPRRMKAVHNSLRMWLFARHMTFANYAVSTRRLTENGIDGIRIWRVK